MLKLDFLDYKTIFQYIFIITISLVGGAILKDGIALIFGLLIIYFSLNRKLHRALESFYIWFFISGYFIGQSYITITIVSKFIAKPSFLLFLIFLSFINKIPISLLKSGFIKVWILFLIISLLGSITQGQSPFVIITISSFFIVYLLMQAEGMNQNQYAKILNLFIAVAIIQTAVSFLQVSELIAPPSKMMVDDNGVQFEWTAGLDDVASGTFGAGASHITSWYAAFISLFMLIMWSLTKNIKYLVFMAITFLQFATVDSKTIMGVTILMIGYMLYYLFKEKVRFKISIARFVSFLLILSIGVFGFYKAWNTYYNYYGEKTGGSRTDVNSVYKNEAEESIILILANIGDWGKIKGYQNILEDFFQNDPIQLVWGYGLKGYEYSTKMGYIESLDTPLMKLNNLTRSRSGLIRQFATSGLLGFILFTTAIFLWQKICKPKIFNQYDLISISLLKIFLPFTFFSAFLYSIEFTSIPVIIFAATVSIYMKLSQNYMKEKK